MKKFLPFSRRQPSLDRYTVNKGGWSGSERFNGKSMRRTSATSISARSIQVVRGAYNIDLNKVDSSFTKLHRACLLNDDAQVKKHLHKVDNNSHDSSKRYPIHLATVNGNFAIVKLLIENQANPNVQDNEGHTPIIKSIECRHEHLVKYLLNNGSDPNITDFDNNTALHWALMTESIIAIDALMSSKKCDLSLRNNKDETCLHLAVRCPLINTLTYENMMRAGSDLEARDQLGLTPVDIAQACNNKTAMNVFNRFRESDQQLGSTKNLNTSAIEETEAEFKQASAKKMSEEYKLKYIAKNRENLEYEKRLIQLTAQIERLTLDLTFMREQTEKLETDYEKLFAENSKLKQENSQLLEQINRSKQKENESIAASREHKCNDPILIGLDKNDTHLNSVECQGHEEFLATKALLDKRINQLRCKINQSL